MWRRRGLLSELGAVGVLFHSAVTTARHELEECFYQIKTEMLILQYVMLGTVLILLSSFSQRVLFLFFFFSFLHKWDCFISKMKVPLLFLFFNRLYTNHCQDFTSIWKPVHESRHSNHFTWSFPGFFIQIFAYQSMYVYFSSLCNIRVEYSAWPVQSGREFDKLLQTAWDEVSI